jgi:hypothetical protein
VRDDSQSDNGSGRTDATASPEVDAIHLPGPSFWPLVVALGVTVAMAGLLIHVAMAALGVALVLVAIIAWGLEGGQQ